MRKRYFARSPGARVDQPLSNDVARGADGEIDVLGACIRNLGERLFVARRNARRVLGRARLDPLAADEEPVAVLEADDLPRLRRLRVLERGGNRRAVLFFLDLGHQSMVK